MQKLLLIKTSEQLESVLKLVPNELNTQFDDSDNIERCWACWEYTDAGKPFYVQLCKNTFSYNHSEELAKQGEVYQFEELDQYLKDTGYTE